jgi:hypothetical protein
LIQTHGTVKQLGKLQVFRMWIGHLGHLWGQRLITLFHGFMTKDFHFSPIPLDFWAVLSLWFPSCCLQFCHCYCPWN